MQINITENEFIDMWLDPNISLKQIEDKSGISQFLLKKLAKDLELPVERKRGRPLKEKA